jgi:ATP-dependent DNA helicase RecQ
MQGALPPERAAASSVKKRVRVGGGGGGGGTSDDDEPIDEPLFARLRELRARLAKEERLPAYCVFHDRTLAALARQRPATLDEMAAVPGVGPSKLAKYGAAFLDALRAPDG